MAKKRKESTQGATLLDFFGKPGSPQANKKSKVKGDPTSTQTASRTTARRIIPEEIIVIDSDDDDDVEVVRHVASSSRLTKNAIASSSKLPDSSRNYIGTQPSKPPLHGRPSVEVIEARTRRYTTPSPSSKDSVAQVHSPFGPPSELLCPISRVVARESSPFGTPFMLLSTSSQPSATPAATVDVEMDVDEEALWATQDSVWGTGDDEMDSTNPENIIEVSYEEAEIDLTLEGTPPPAGDEVEQVCPVCEASFEELTSQTFQEHVNGCLDSHPGSPERLRPPRPLPLATTPTLRPLTSLQPPIFISKDSPGLVALKSEPADTSGTDLFSVMMTSHKENEAWKEASAAEDRNFRPTKNNGGRRKAPFYKVMPGMPIAVDAFRYGTIPGVTAYFLTHAHSDHYTNLSSNWKSGSIYCSQGTANLIVHMLAVDRKWVHPLPMDVPTLIPDSGGVRVTLIEANHCPGSCLFLFEGPQTINAGDSAFKSPYVGSPKIFRYLHCGDFRASPQHVLHPAVKGKRLDQIYLDTTYLDPKYCFPPQPQVITACAELAKRIVTGQPLQDGNGKANMTMDRYVTVQDKQEGNGKQGIKPEKILVVVGTYSIGKERIVKAIAHALQTKVYCDSKKTAILRCQPDPELHALLTSDPYNAGIHLVPLGVISSDRLKEYMGRWKGHFSKAVGFRPTGWTYSPPSGTDMLPTISTVISRSQSRTFTHAQLQPARNSSGTLQVYGVPYSEHSSFFELTCFALSCDWIKMIATVNVGSESSRKKMAKWVERWEAERKKRSTTQVVDPRADDYW